MSNRNLAEKISSLKKYTAQTSKKEFEYCFRCEDVMNVLSQYLNQEQSVESDAVEFAKWLDDIKINADKHFNMLKSATTQQLYQEFKKQK